MRKRGRTAFIVSFLAPAVLLYGVFVVWPVIQAFFYSMYRWRGVSQQREFVGVDNFKELSADPVVWQSLQHNMTLLVGAGGAILIIALAVAHAMQGETKAVKALRGIYLFPQIISMVVVAILWQFVYHPTIGILPSILKAVGLERWAFAWLGEPKTALLAVSVPFVWHALGFYIMLFAAGLKGIPSEVTEAATLDGASGFAKLWNVTLPMLWSVLRVAVVYVVITSVNVFALVFLMTQGGPDRRSEVMLTYLYEQAFTRSEFGMATALAIMNLAVVLLLSGLVMRMYRREAKEAVA
jgi:N-acetylglucosamine transport system permease protein